MIRNTSCFTMVDLLVSSFSTWMDDNDFNGWSSLSILASKRLPPESFPILNDLSPNPLNSQCQSLWSISIISGIFNSPRMTLPSTHSGMGQTVVAPLPHQANQLPPRFGLVIAEAGDADCDCCGPISCWWNSRMHVVPSFYLHHHYAIASIWPPLPPIRQW